VAGAQAKALRAEKAIDGALAAVRAAGYAAKTAGGQTPSGDAGSQQSPPKSSPSKCPKSEQSDDASDDAGGCGEA
jgi:hypothetical protein